MNDRLYRSIDDRFLAGVCGGLAERLGMDPSLVRVAWVILTLVSGGLFLVIYIVMAIVVPEEDFAYYPPPSPMPPGMSPDASAPAAATATDAAGAPVAPSGAAAPMTGWGPPTHGAQWRAERRAARAARRAERGPGQGSAVFGIILILLGGWFLLEQYVPAFDAGRLWPFVVIILGVVLLAYAIGGRPGGKPQGQP